MAASGDQEELSSTLNAGPKLLFEFFCHICEEENRHVEAVGFCKNCNDYLCDSCFRIHCKPKPVRHHVLLDKDHMPRDVSLVRTRVSTYMCTDYCLEHPDKAIEYFCQSHQVLACSICAIGEHRACERLDHIPEVSEGIADSKELEEMIADLTTMDSKARNIIKTSKGNISVIQRLSSEAITSLKKFRKDVDTLLDNLEKSITNKTETNQSDDTNKMEEISTNCSTAVSEIGNISNSLATMRNNKQNCSMYIALKRARVTLQSIQHRIEKAGRDNRITEYAFQYGSQLQDLLKKSDALGKISVANSVHDSTDSTTNVTEETVVIPHKPKLIASDGKKTNQISEIKTGNKSDESKMPDPEATTSTVGNKETMAIYVSDINYRSKEASEDCWITGSVLLTPSKLAVTDFSNTQVKVIDIQQHSIVSDIQLQSKPWDVTLVNPGQLAVTLPDVKKIQYLDITKKCSLSESKDILVNGQCKGIAYAKDRLVVSYIFPGKLEILTLNGDVQHTIATDAVGRQLFTYPEYLALNPDGDTIYVSDYDTDTVTSLTTTGNVLYVYRNNQLEWPRGLVVVAGGTVYVCGYVSGDVHMLTARCELIKVLLTKEELKRCPDSISYCEDNKQLFISTGKNNIKVYQLT